MRLESRVEKPTPETDPKKQAEAAKRPWTAIAEAKLRLELPPKGSQAILVKLPSPVVLPKDRAKLLALDYAAARAETLKFWGDYVARGRSSMCPRKRSTICSAPAFGTPSACRGATAVRSPG